MLQQVKALVGMDKQITTEQIKALRTAAAKLFDACTCKSGSVCDFHHWLAVNFNGVLSTKQLPKAQASEAIAALRQMTGFNAGGTGAKGNRGGWLTETQAWNIKRLADKLGWEDQQVRRFIKRQTGKVQAPQWLRSYEATKVITGMMNVAGER